MPLSSRPWIVAGVTNAGLVGRCYPVVLDKTIDPNDPLWLRFRPGPWECILCSNPDTARWIADQLNQKWAASDGPGRPRAPTA